MTPPDDLATDELIGVIAVRVVERLQQVLDRECGRWIGTDPDLGPPLTALARLVLGDGKRLRPAFCYWAYVGAGAIPSARRSSTPGPASSCCTPSPSCTTT